MRLICVSDTHGYHRKLNIPDGDVFIHAGDFSMRANDRQVLEFSNWVNSLPHKHKIVLAGNHDFACEGNECWVKEEFLPTLFLDHTLVTLEGMNFFGSPYSVAINNPSTWYYDYPRGGEKGKRLWDSIKHLTDLDVLITHGPPYKIGDRVLYPDIGEDPNVGDSYLTRVVMQIQPKIHIFGHIHEGYGKYSLDKSICKTDFYNVSTCNVDYKPVNPVTIIDLI